jgi:hypothetical protein
MNSICLSDKEPDAASEPDQFLRVLCDAQLDPLFWRAAVIDPHSAWCSHIPFAHWVVRATSPRVIVELGTHTGVSYMALCLAVEREQSDAAGRLTSPIRCARASLILTSQVSQKP